MKSLERLNQAPTSEADSMFLDCCGSATWASMMTMVRPFESEDQLLNIAASMWKDLATEDRLDAFSAHPRIGETKAAPGQQVRSATWSEGEQAGVGAAEESVKRDLAEANREYFEKFGFIFIVCATGKSADEMLRLCRTRTENDRETEIANAAREQQQITELRLRKLLAL